MSKIENACKFMEAVARDNSHGYDQIDRWGHPDYDCSGLVITACERSGIPLKSAGATYTGNILKPALKIGFKDVVNSVNLKTGSGLKRCDILLSPGHHVAMYCGNDKMVDARINEKGKITGGKSGDQTGREIMIHDYRNHPFSHVLRWAGDDTSTNSGGSSSASSKPSIEQAAKNVIAGKYGNGDARKSALKKLGFSDSEITAIQARVNAILKAGSSSSSSNSSSAKKASPADHFKVGTVYTVQVNNLNVRTGPGTGYSRKTRSQLTADGRKHANSAGQLYKGTRTTCKAVKAVGSSVWINTPSGWLCAYNGSKYYVY